MSFDLSSLKSNATAEQDGVWVDYLNGSRLLIARMGNPNYKRFASLRYKQHRVTIDRNDANADKLAEELSIEADARHILLGWENVEIDGKNAKYSPELGVKVLTEIPDFRADVLNFANDASLFRDSAAEDDVEKLKKQ